MPTITRDDEVIVMQPQLQQLAEVKQRLRYAIEVLERFSHQDTIPISVLMDIIVTLKMAVQGTEQIHMDAAVIASYTERD